MNAVLTEENSHDVAKLALPHFDFDHRAPLAFVKLRENCVFRVDDPSGPIALRLHRPGYRSLEEIAAESRFIAALADEGLPVVELVRTPAGAHTVLIEHNGLQVVVDAQRWVSAAQPLGSSEAAFAGTSPLTEADFEQMGALAARMHAASQRLSTSGDFPRSPWDAEGMIGADALWGDPLAAPGLSEEDRETLGQAREAMLETLRDYGTSPTVYGLIHADFTPENLLTSEDGLVIIDFDDFGAGWFLFDLATALFFYLADQRYEAFRAALLRGYRAHRPLDRAEEDLLELFITARGFTYLGWAATRPETETAAFIAEEIAPIVVRRAAAIARRTVPAAPALD
ncbi:phosphotransferase [Nocardia sp. R7R-8]|uniref:phosphotransferase n=1 Tax=Nocardia sp. R7R-8 TaxID=3459304 RepID=UPI00403DE9F4